MMESGNNIQKYINTNIVDIKNENKLNLYQISLFPNFKENIINFPSSKNEKKYKQLKKKNQNNNIESKITNKKKNQNNQNNQKKKVKSKNNLYKKSNVNQSNTKKNFQNYNQSNENFSISTNDIYFEDNSQNDYENYILNPKLNEKLGNSNSHNNKKNSPMINGNELNNVNKSMYEKHNGNIPYNNIGVGSSKIKNDNQIYNSNIQKNISEKDTNGFYNKEFNQINLKQDISNFINDNIYSNNNLLTIKNNQIYYDTRNDICDKNFHIYQNNNFIQDKIKNNNFYNNYNINKIINNDNIGLNISINNNINNILHSNNEIKYFNDEFKFINNAKIHQEKIIKKNVNKNEKKFILMSDILTNIYPEINYEKYKEQFNKHFVTIQIKNNNNEDINYYLYENDNPINLVEKIVLENNIKIQKIPMLFQIINNGINYIKHFNSFNLEDKSIKDLIMLKNILYSNNIKNDYFNNSLNLDEKKEIDVLNNNVKMFINEGINSKGFK